MQKYQRVRGSGYFQNAQTSNHATQSCTRLASLNEDLTVRFYTDKLGFTFHSSWDGYLIFSRDNITIRFWPCKDPEIPKATGCYINVTEVDKLYAEFKAKGVIHPNVDLKDRPWKMRLFSILNNNGILFILPRIFP